MGLPLTKLLVRGPQVFPLSCGEACPCDFDQPLLCRDHPSIVHLIVPNLLWKIASLQQFVCNEFFGADQQRVPRERRQRLIWRISISSGTERQSLPPALSSIAQAIDPEKRLWAQIANSVGRGQRSDVQQ